MYTYQQLEQMWIANGGDPVFAPIMAAIAMAESSGDAGNTTGDNGTSWGLYQVHWTVHPQFNQQSLLDPNYNTNAAIQLSGNGQNLSPWTTWEDYINNHVGTNGYNVISKYLGTPGSQSIPSPTSSSSSPTTQTASNTSGVGGPAYNCNGFDLPCIQKYITDGLSYVGDNLLVASFAIGFIFIGAIWIISGNKSTATTIVKVAKTSTNTAS